MLVLNASGIILGDKRVNNWFEREIEKYRTKIRTSLLKIIFLYPTLWESRNNDDISCQIIWILLSLITNQAWLGLTLSLSSLTVYTSFNKRQCVVCSGLFLPFPDDLLSILLKLILNEVASSGRPSLSRVEYQKVESCCNQWSRIQCTSKRNLKLNEDLIRLRKRCLLTNVVENLLSWAWHEKHHKETLN